LMYELPVHTCGQDPLLVKQANGYGLWLGKWGHC
jgi:hypothetical protein